MENRMSITIPDEVVSGFQTKMDEAMALIQPYLVTVTDEQKKSLLKVGDKTTAFVSKALEYIKSSGAEYLMDYIDPVEFEKDQAAVSQLRAMRNRVAQLNQSLEDTHALAANDAYAQALAYYNLVKSAGKAGQATAKAIYEDLSQRFPGRGTSRSTDNDA